MSEPCTSSYFRLCTERQRSSQAHLSGPAHSTSIERPGRAAVILYAVPCRGVARRFIADVEDLRFHIKTSRHAHQDRPMGQIRDPTRRMRHATETQSSVLTGSSPLLGVAHGAMAARFVSSVRVRLERPSWSTRSCETVVDMSRDMRMAVGKGS
ncbi:hypothetical protein PYCCODRAFT_1302887 [Trametes coccinea BRFM310]|uniref:Uncharacterized protein n=1 Tax=Trametes coccinea (strain BRFM310) TaxID=1353009 RepID=A0A1Y2I5Z7_TRAC3|nr:hypothetical protein PYCCODRAFT_1302887 [Trametes coccinea BRFM310]